MAVRRFCDPMFQQVTNDLLVPQMGTDTVAPLLGLLVRMLRPRRVLEVGMGYTTPFIAAALAEVEEQAAAESARLAAKTGPYLAGGAALDEEWLNADPALAAPSAHLEPYRPRFIAVDNMSIPDSSAPQVRKALAELGLTDRVTLLNADVRDCADALPDDFAPIDLAWVDAWECLYFFDHFWERMNPDGGVMIFHYLMTYPEGEAILRYIAGFQRTHPGELEVLNLLESHKLTQNSVTVLRRTSDARKRRYGTTGGVVRFDETLRADAARQHELSTEDSSGR